MCVVSCVFACAVCSHLVAVIYYTGTHAQAVHCGLAQIQIFPEPAQDLVVDSLECFMHHLPHVVAAKSELDGDILNGVKMYLAKYLLHLA